MGANFKFKGSLVIKRLALVYLALWLSLLSAGAFVSAKFIASSQVAFFASLLVLAASFRAYRTRVLSRVPIERERLGAFNYDNDFYDFDALKFEPNANSLTCRAKIFTPKFYFDAYAKQNASELNLKEMIKLEKERTKREKGAKFSHIQTAFVPYRLIAYGVLVLGFLVLKRRDLLDIAGFLVGLAVMPIGAFVFGVSDTKNQNLKERK